MDNIFNKLVQAEKDFQKSEFVAPIFSDKVVANIAGINSIFRVRPSDYRGWAVLNPTANKIARVVKEPSRSVKMRYLEMLPAFNMVVCDIEKRLGVISNTDNRVPIVQPLPFYLADNISLFQHIKVRFDGMHFIYERRSPTQGGNNLADALEANIKPETRNFTKGWKEAYEYCYFNKQKELLGNKEYQIRSAIEKAGGNYISYSDINNNEINVSYEINGQTYTSTIEENLQVICAGICLHGEDVTFDLQSLVAVVQEGQRRGRIVEGDWRQHYNG